MKTVFYVGIAGLIAFEILNVYFIMPMPGSQQMRSIDAAYFLYTYRWVFRVIFGLFIVAGALPAWRASRWVAIGALLVSAGIGYAFNFRMAADHMFYQPQSMQMKKAPSNVIGKEKLIIGVVMNGEASAYPVQLIGYHHQVLDTVGGKPMMVTYCTVCRTGRVFEPLVNGRLEKFRLVGMDHFNAMFEDATTGSWWRQATGEAIAGKLTGQALPEVFSQQTSLAQWLALYPDSRVMQPDSVFAESYERMKNYETGKSTSDLTRTDSLPWKEKSWVVGVEHGNQSKAFDWNRLKNERIIHDTIGNQPILLVMASDTVSFFAFARPSPSVRFRLKNDTLVAGDRRYTLGGEAIGHPEGRSLRKLNAYQEFWHSWQTFHPTTTRDQ